MMADDVESLTASLVREYLSRKGLKNSLAVLDQEMPRDEHSVSNRAQLAKEIHIERLMKKNKEHTIVYRTMLEVIVQYFREKGLSSSTTNVAKKDATVPDTSRPSTAGFKSARERRLSADKNRKVNKPSELTENFSEDKLDYIDLLQRLEKSERVSKEREIKDVVHISSIPLTENIDIPPAKETASSSFTPSKTHRSRTRSAGLAGPVVSSGLAGMRGKRPGHTKSQTSELAITGHKFQAVKTSSDDVSFKRQMGTLNKDDILSSEKEENTRVLSARKEVQNHIFNKSSPISDKIDKVKKTATSRPGSSVGSRKNHQQQKEELVFEDIDDDLDDSIAQLSLGTTHALMADFENKPISLEQAMALKNLIFGSAKSCFNQEWRQQSFNFCDHYGLEYGIVQHKGGPCGVLAAVQAFVLKNLLFGEQRKSDSRSCLQPLPHERTKALATSITDILWQAGDFKSATVALPAGFGNSNFVGAGRYKPDQLTENLVLRTYNSRDGLNSYINQQIKQFEDQSSSGCILLLYSSILSRTIKQVTSDMDDPNNKLMGAHGYCSQEMVNLIITGRATSNAFDNVIELDSGGSSAAVLLKGLDKQADVGFLSLFEHYGSCQIGMNYKNPKFPIWVVCSESHFSVMFSTNRTLSEEWDQKTRFDLYYYDGLSRQDEEIRLTVDTSQECPDYQDGELVPPLEHVIRTRWKKAVIDWNGTEPIL